MSDELLEKEFKTIEFQFIKRFKKKPSLEAILLLIGYQESPEVKSKHGKEEKLDLINLGVLTVLETQGLFKRTGTDHGWPVFEPSETQHSGDKEKTLRAGIVAYFRQNELSDSGKGLPG